MISASDHLERIPPLVSINDYLPLVLTIAHKLHARLPSSVDVQDLINTGVLGLMEAAERFDDSKGVPFQAFANTRIRGSMVDSLRSADWVPRAVRKRASLIEDTVEALTSKLGRAPTDVEVASALEISLDKYHRMRRNSQVRSILSLDAPTHAENPTPLVDQISDDSDGLLTVWEGHELKETVVNLMHRLPERERIAVSMYYLEEKPLSEVGDALGVSESRASQLHRSGVERLRHKICEYVNGGCSSPSRVNG